MEITEHSTEENEVKSIPAKEEIPEPEKTEVNPPKSWEEFMAESHGSKEGVANACRNFTARDLVEQPVRIEAIERLETVVREQANEQIWAIRMELSALVEEFIELAGALGMDVIVAAHMVSGYMRGAKVMLQSHRVAVNLLDEDMKAHVISTLRQMARSAPVREILEKALRNTESAGEVLAQDLAAKKKRGRKPAQSEPVETGEAN